MAWSDPGDFTSGQILTAAQMDAIREGMFFGMPTFTTETARDTAYGAPLSPITLQEGMRAYLTAPTTAVVNATGATTVLPSGVTTVYNGSAWVCTTPVAAFSNTSGTHNTSTYVSTLTGDGTAISVTLNTGTTAMILAQCLWSPSTAATVNVSVAVSGATTITAVNSNVVASVAQGSGNFNTVSPLIYVLTGLTAGVNTFTLNYSTSAGTVTFTKRYLTVQGIA